MQHAVAAGVVRVAVAAIARAVLADLVAQVVGAEAELVERLLRISQRRHGKPRLDLERVVVDGRSRRGRSWACDRASARTVLRRLCVGSVAGQPAPTAADHRRHGLVAARPLHGEHARDRGWLLRLRLRHTFGRLIDMRRTM